MIKFSQLRTEIDKVIKRMEDTKLSIRSYSKFDYDFRAPALVEEIDKTINQINNVYQNVYGSPDFINQYGKNSNHDYTEYIKMISNRADEFQKICERIKKFESVTGYY